MAQLKRAVPLLQISVVKLRIGLPQKCPAHEHVSASGYERRAECFWRLERPHEAGFGRFLESWRIHVITLNNK